MVELSCVRRRRRLQYEVRSQRQGWGESKSRWRKNEDSACDKGRAKRARNLVSWKWWSPTAELGTSKSWRDR